MNNGNEHAPIDYTNKDYAALREAMLALASEKLPDWTDHSPNDLGVVLVELFAYMGDLMLHYQDRISNESYLDTAVERRSIIHLLRLIGYELRPPRPASADLTLFFDPAFDPDAEGSVTIAAGSAFETSAEATGTPVTFRYLGDDPLMIELSALKLDSYRDARGKEKQGLRFDTLPVIQADAHEPSEIVGSSDGSAGQRFALARMPLIDGTLELRVDEGGVPSVWEPHSSLLHSLSPDTHYVVRRDEEDRTWIEFGDGKYGKIPRRGHNNITASYLVGGGAKGNVPPYTITKAVTDVQHLVHVQNQKAASGGAEPETIPEAAMRGPRVFRAAGRAVTGSDYEAHAMEYGVGKVRARAPGWNRVELYVAPVGGGYPSDTLKADLRSYFEDKRMLTSFLEICDPEYQSLYIKGTLDVLPYFFEAEVQQRVQNAVHRLLAFDNVEFGETLYLSKIYEAIEAVEGVAGVTVTRFAHSDSTSDLPPDGKFELGWSQIPRTGYPEGIQLRVQGGRRAQ